MFIPIWVLSALVAAIVSYQICLFRNSWRDR